MSTFFSESASSATSDLRDWSEERLLAAAKRGRRAPFGELCERHVSKVFRVIHRIMRNREDAEDAIQDSFLSAFVHLKDFDERSQFATWLTRIAINAALAKLRKSYGKRELHMDEPNPASGLEGHPEIEDDGPDPEEIYRLCEREQILNTAISRLRPKSRRAVELHQLQELSVRETAQILGISTSAVKSRIFDAKVAMRQMTLVQGIVRSNRENGNSVVR